MQRLKSSVAIFQITLLTLPLTAGAQVNVPNSAPGSDKGPMSEKGASTRIPTVTREKSRLPKLLGNYETASVSPVNAGNTARLDSLLRGGNLYLSLQDAIALALENNINVEVQRYG